MTEHTIAGEWHGRYVYDKVPTAGGDFAAFFSEVSGALHGSIVDDGASGKATVNGTFSFPTVEFTKVYAKSSESKKVEKKFVPRIKLLGFGIGHQIISTTTETFGPPVLYSGTMSQDGKSLSGKWKIQNEEGIITSAGTWTMTKLSEDEHEKEAETKVSRVREREIEEVS